MPSPLGGRQLYSNLLGANWSAPQLARLLLLGNSIPAYAASPAAAEAAAAWSPLFRATPLLREAPTPPMQTALDPRELMEPSLSREAAAARGVRAVWRVW